MFLFLLCVLFLAPLWANVYLWVDAWHHEEPLGFSLESFACALLSVVTFVAAWVYRHTELRLPLRVATHSLVAFGGIFCAVDLHRPHQWIRVLALLGFHANLLAVFLWDFKIPNRKCPDPPAGDGV